MRLREKAKSVRYSYPLEKSHLSTIVIPRLHSSHFHSVSNPPSGPVNSPNRASSYPYTGVVYKMRVYWHFGGSAQPSTTKSSSAGERQFAPSGTCDSQVARLTSVSSTRACRQKACPGRTRTNLDTSDTEIRIDPIPIPAIRR